ncbi:MAG: type I DNA topoisomerase [Phycisphaerae bacterium]|nr:type I DNA topoisomerase [Phycisphaerae bacterium]
MPKRPATAGITSKKKAAPPELEGEAGESVGGSGRQLVIVESPAKAKTINKYLGGDFHVVASVGHIRDLPSKAPKGSKQPVPGVDLEHDFEPSYEVMPDKKKTVSDLRAAAKKARSVWFATDLDREGEAIAWHLTQILGIDPTKAKRVIFNAITRTEIQKAFDHPHEIDLYKVNAQQARRILDRIVGYQVSPLLWRKVARGLSAGRVQSVAVRLVVEREREIASFVPDERWEISARMADPSVAPGLVAPWSTFLATKDERGNPPTQRAQFGWLAERKAIRAELVELGGKPFDVSTTAREAKDLSKAIAAASDAVGLLDVRVQSVADPNGKGPASMKRTVEGRLDPAARYRVTSIETERRSTRPYAPFITSTLQQSASSFLGFGADRTMRVAQGLYEGVNVAGEGQVGLITYMRTDSTQLSGEALGMARDFIEKEYGQRYLPAKPNFFGSSNKDAQEAHEAIRPTDVRRTPESVKGSLTEDQYKLYRLIWNRFVACQMTPAEFDGTTVLLARSDKPTGAVFKATGRVLVFDGFYKVAGAPSAEDEQTLPAFAQGDVVSPFFLASTQKFSSPPPRYNEASLIRKLEEEGIGRPSTYASILRVIEDRGYVEQVERRYHATDVGMVVTDKLVEGFPELMDVGYTRSLEADLDKIEEAHTDWKKMLRDFYGSFSKSLEKAGADLKHAKAEIEPAPYACPKCGKRTSYRFGKNGRFLSCSGYPECDYAAPIDRQGRPTLPERVDVQCPEDGSAMVLRTGRFGKFLASVNYPAVKFVLNLDKKGRLKLPAPPALVTDLICPKCQKSPLNLRNGKRGPWLGCSGFPKCRGRETWSKLDEKTRERLERALAAHEKANPPAIVKHLDGRPIKDGTPIADLALPGGTQELKAWEG